MDNVQLLKTLEAISGSNHWATLVRIANAAKRRLIDVPMPTYTAAQVQRLFSPGMTVEIANNLKDSTIHGAVAKVTQVLQTNLVIELGSRSIRIPASCVIPAPDLAAAVESGTVAPPPVVSDPVQITTLGKYQGKTGIIVAQGKRYSILLDGTTGSLLKADAQHFTVLPKPAPNPNLVVCFKTEYGTGRKAVGSVMLYDLTLAKPGDPLDFDKGTPGVTDFGWHDVLAARAIANARGASFQTQAVRAA